MNYINFIIYPGEQTLVCVCVYVISVYDNLQVYTHYSRNALGKLLGETM